MHFNDKGEEVLDNTPLVKHTRLRMPASQLVRMRNLIRHEMSLQAEAQGQETFEEADDFELPEGEGDWVSPYEVNFEPPIVSDTPSPADKGAPAPPAASAAAVPDEEPPHGL